MVTIGDHLAGLLAEQREALQRVVDVAARVAPDAVEGTSYGMPALRLHGNPLIGVSAAAGHLSAFPFSPAVVDADGRRPPPDLLRHLLRRFQERRHLA